MSLAIQIILAFIYGKFVMEAQGSTECPKSTTKRGFALLNAVYSSKVIPLYFDCVNECINDPLCMSINFWWQNRKCDFNNKTRSQNCSACFVADKHSTYMDMEKPFGQGEYNIFNYSFKRFLI